MVVKNSLIVWTIEDFEEKIIPQLRADFLHEMKMSEQNHQLIKEDFESNGGKIDSFSLRVKWNCALVVNAIPEEENS